MEALEHRGGRQANDPVAAVFVDGVWLAETILKQRTQIDHDSATLTDGQRWTAQDPRGALQGGPRSGLGPG